MNGGVGDLAVTGSASSLELDVIPCAADSHDPSRGLPSFDRGWIVPTLLDLDATDGEVEAAFARATDAEVARALHHLDMQAWWLGERQHDLAGLIAHMREQHQALGG